MASVKVAVRVRPFNQREIDMGAKLILKMDGKKTRITNTTYKGTDRQGDQYKHFTFDYSYWSYDNHDPHYAPQEQVFKDLGTEVVDAAFEGYNACVFAYGQTGSGKTFTMMGSKDNQGLIPRICESLFKRMALGANYRIEVSYLEIYNEKVKDLLRKDSGHNLKVRQHPTRGPCVMDLSRHLVSEYCHIQELMQRGNNQRTTASTNMNDVSSRSHAIFTLMFVQAQGTFFNDMPSETVSKVHLVDLAGSERADASGATGQRLKEGAHINKSLVTLGSVISALAELSANNGRKTSGFIPYRDSVLTWLLKDSLGGNSKTIMIAAISPADCNYSETLSTLRYANRAKNIINKPTINEDENVKLIRDLREEITKLKAMVSGNEYTTEVQPKVLAVLQEKEAQEKVLVEEWTEKWRETQKILQEQKALGLRKAGAGAGVVLDSDMPHLIGIDDDLLSTGVTLYHLNDGETLIGSSDADDRQDIVLNGVDVEKQHCSIVLNNGVATLMPHQNALCWVNGLQVNKPTRLSQGCNILLGRTNMFRYNDPVEVQKLRKEGSRSLLNLSRMSLMSWSTPDLCREVENINSSVGNDDSLMSRSKNESLIHVPETTSMEEDEEVEESESSRNTLQIQENLAAERQLESRLVYEEQSRQLAADRVKLELSKAQVQAKEEELNRRLDTLHPEYEKKTAIVVSGLALIAEMQTNLDRKRQELELVESKSSHYFSQDNDNSSPPIAHLLRQDIKRLECELETRREALLQEQLALGTIVEELQNQGEPNYVLATNKNERNQRKHKFNLNLTPQLGSSRPLATSSPNINSRPEKCGGEVDDLESPDSDCPRTSRNHPRSLFSQISGEDSDADNLYQMKYLMQQISNQRQLIMRCLETEINPNDLNRHITVLQEMKREYVRLEQRLQDQEDSSSKENVKINVSMFSQDTCDSDDLSTSADDTISESLLDNRRYRSRGCLNCAVLSKSSQDIRYRILQDRLQMSLAPSLSVSSQNMDRLAAPNYTLTRSMPSLNRICVWDGRSEDLSEWDGRLVISVPNYLIRGAGRNTHFVYEIVIRVEGETYSILRRYKRFRELHLVMKHKYGDPVGKLAFPPRKLFLWQMDGELLAKERRPLLESYLRRLISTCSAISSCPLYNCSTKAALHLFSPFFKRGTFETGKYGTG